MNRAEVSGAGPKGSLKVVFFAGRTVRQYGVLVTELVRRGHLVHVALSRRPDDLDFLAADVRGSPLFTHDVAPMRPGTSAWWPLAWLIRAVADVARYSHPRYAAAPVLRRRLTKKTADYLEERRRRFDPLTRTLGLLIVRRLEGTTDPAVSARAIRIAARLEAVIPSSPPIDRYVRHHRPDAVLVSDVVKRASAQVEYLKSARRLGIPAATCVASWDNLTNKGLLKFVPERVFVWNEVQRREAVELHGMPAERVVATGAQQLDKWFGRRPSMPREEFVRKIGLDPSRPYVLFLCSSPFVSNHDADGEVRFVTTWIEALRASVDERLRGLGVVVRPHPVGTHWKSADLRRFDNVVVWPRKSPRPFVEAAVAELHATVAHSAAVVGINTTAMIEAAIVGKSVLTVLAPEFVQEGTLHFHYLLEENGGFLHVASSLREHVEQLRRVLDEPEADAERRRAFVASFVRPCGLDRPATEVYADAVEELAGLPVDGPARAPAPLRLAVAAVAGLSRLMLGVRRGRLRLRRRLEATRRRLPLASGPVP